MRAATYPGGHEAEDEAGRDGHRDREREHRRVDGHVLQLRDLGDRSGIDRRDAPAGDRRAGDTASQRQRETFEQELPDEATRVAPSAACVAISRWRATVRASCRLATLAHVSRRRSPTAAKSTSVAWRTGAAPAIP